MFQNASSVKNTERFQIQCDYRKLFFKSTKSNQAFYFPMVSETALFDRKT